MPQKSNDRDEVGTSPVPQDPDDELEMAEDDDFEDGDLDDEKNDDEEDD